MILITGAIREFNMRIKKPSPTVTTFLEAYRSAFEQLDADAIAELFVYPLHVTGDDELITPASIGSREEWTNQLRRLLRGYRAMEFSSANILDLSVIELSPRLLQVFVHWDLRDRDEASLYDFKAAYTLVEIARNLKITAIAHNELPRFRTRLNVRSTGT